VNHLRVGLSGCGVRGALVVRQVRTHQECDVIALHDPDAAAMQRLGDGQGIARRCAGFDDLLQTGIDFVVLAGPCGDRLEQVRAAAAQGVHCLLHSPMAPDAAIAAAMVQACEAAGVKLGVVVPDQADPVLEEVRQMIANDWLGAPVLATSLLAEDTVLRAPPPEGHWRRQPARAGDGALTQLASEHLHLLLWLVGRAVLSVTAQSASGFTAVPQDGAVATALLRGGTLCTFASSHLARGNTFALHGTDGAVQIAADRLSLRGRTEWHGDILDYPEADAELTLLRSDLASMVATAAQKAELHGRFARWIDDCDDFPCPGEQAAADLRALDGMLRAARSGRREDVTG